MFTEKKSHKWTFAVSSLNKSEEAHAGTMFMSENDRPSYAMLKTQEEEEEKEKKI